MLVKVPDKLRALGYPEQVWKTVRQSFGDRNNPHRSVSLLQTIVQYHDTFCSDFVKNHSSLHICPLT